MQRTSALRTNGSFNTLFSLIFFKLKEVEAVKGEGLMLRKPQSEYIGTRSDTLLKVKTFFDEEATVIGHLEGSGKYKGVISSLQCQLPNGKTFQVSGLTDKEKVDPPKIGTQITFKYQELTPDGIPRFPSYVGIRAD